MSIPTEKFYGFYRGIVVQNNDPNRRGRVKIFTKELAIPILQSLYLGKETQEPIGDLAAKFAGTNIDTFLTPDFIEKLQEVAIWAEQASPLIGGGSSGFYNAQTSTASVSHANKNKQRFDPVNKPIRNLSSANTAIAGELPTSDTGNGEIDPITGVASTLEASAANEQPNNDNLTEEERSALLLPPLTKDGTGVNGAKKFEVSPPIGGHNGYEKDNINNPNPFNNSIEPTSYTNQASGLFGVPNVGAHVWLFFEGGNLQYPVYFAFNYDDKDWNGSYHVNENNPGRSYPDHSENISLSAVGSNQKEFVLRNKTVWKSKGGSVEIIDDDQAESIKINQYNGSFIQLGNYNNIDFSNTNKTTLVNEHNWTTVKGTNNLNVQKDNDTMVDGNNYTKVGKPNLIQQFANWVQVYSPIALILSQFNILRAKATKSKVFGVLNVDSTQSGTFAKNPAYYDYNSSSVSEISQSNNTDPIQAVNNEITLPFNATPALITSSTTNASTHYENSNVGLTDTTSAETPTPPDIANEDSPSSKNGTWDKNTNKEQAGVQLKKLANQLAQIEKEMGVGGNEIVQILKDKIEIVGAVTNDLPAIRIDDVGDISVTGVHIDEESSCPIYKEHPYYEPTGMGAPFPGGNSTVIAQNAYNIIAGAGGVQIKTSGITQIGGGVVNIAGQAEVTINSKGNVRISSNGKTQIGSKDPSMKDSLVTLEHPVQVAVDSSLGVVKNIIVGGSTYTEGETYLQHVTAPCEIQETEKSVAYGETISRTPIGYFIDATTGDPIAVYGLASLTHITEIEAAMLTETDTAVIQQYTQELASYGEACTELLQADQTKGAEIIAAAGTKQFSTYPHSHSFKNLPLTLMAGNKGVRQSANGAGLTTGTRGVASPQTHGYKEITSS